MSIFTGKRAFLIFGTGAFLFLFGCGGEPVSEQGSRHGQRAIPYVEIIQAQSGSLPLVQRLNGVVRARNEVSIHAEISGIAEDVFVDNGDWLEAGEPLLRLNSRQAEEQMRQAEAQLRMQQAASEQASAHLKELEVELSLTEELARRDFISELEISRLRARVEIARADLRRALAVVDNAESTVEERRWQLSQTLVRSPVNGYVGRRNVEPGMRIDSSRQLFVIGDLREVRVVVQFPERMIGSIEVGQRAEMFTDSMPDRTFEGRISRISPFVDIGTFSSEASIDLDNRDGLLRSGMYLSVDVFYGETEIATLIPNSALHEHPRSGRIGVFVAGNLARKRGDGESSASWPSSLNAEIGEFRFVPIEIRARGRVSSGVSGIEPGDWVVAVGHDLLARNILEEVQQARVRVIDWDRMASLQSLQDRDVLREFMERHRELSRANH